MLPLSLAGAGLGGPATAVAHLCRTGDDSRPWLVWVHGAGQGQPIDLLFSRARRIRDELGFNIALPIQPGHGSRRTAWPPYPNMDPLTNVAGMMRVVSEVRALVRWLRPQSTVMAVSGVSMGSPVAALVSRFEDVDGVAVYTPILGLNAMISQHLGRWGPSVDDTVDLLGSKTVAAIASAVDHTAVEPTAPPHGRLIVGAWHDRMAMREPAQALHERWGGELFWHKGSHVGHLFAGGVQDASERFHSALPAGVMTTTAAAVPSGVDGLTAEWLSEALGATVTAVRAERIAQDSGFSSLLYRLHLTGDGVPSTMIAKLPAESEARDAMEMLGGYRRELAFYREVAERAPMETPHVYTASMVDGTADFVLLLEDLQHWDNADHLAGLSMNRARVCIDALAGLHAWSTREANAVALDSFPSIDTPIARELLVPAFGPGWQIYREKSSAPVSSAVAAFAGRFAEHAGEALEALTERSMLLHGDIRADNLFFDGDRLKVVDFQFASRGAGVADIAYLVSQGLPAEVRRGHDEALVREYLQRMAAHGVSDYPFDEAWRHYRYAVTYLMVLPVITLIGWDALPERSRALCLTLTDRAVATIDEIDALEVFA